MNCIKNIVIPIIFVVNFTNNNAQNLIAVDCTNDSAFYKSFTTYLDTSAFGNVKSQITESLFLNRQEDCFCKLLIFAKLFDYLLVNGLDLEYSFIKSPPMHNSTNLPPDHEYIKKLNDDYRRFEIYVCYLLLKKKYEEYVVEKYENDKNRLLDRDVTNTVRYNLYSYPTTLQGILLTKNAKILLERFNNEAEIINGKN